MVGEDHGVATLLKEKDSEIADLRARLDDKDRMLNALQSAARSRDTADRDPRASLTLKMLESGPLSPVSARNSQLASLQESGANGSPKIALTSPKKQTKPDEMSKILDEMIQDRVERGELVKGVRGSVRLANGRKLEVKIDPNVVGMEPLKSPRFSPEEAPVVEAV